MPPSLTVNLWRPDSGSTDHLLPFVVPNDVPCDTTFRGVKERTHFAGGPPACFQRLELVYNCKLLELFNGAGAYSTRVLYITLKDDETFISGPYVYNQLMTKRVPHVTFVLITFEGDINALQDPFGENVTDALSIF
jgi:hypothetical protein